MEWSLTRVAAARPKCSHADFSIAPHPMLATLDARATKNLLREGLWLCYVSGRAPSSPMPPAFEDWLP